MDKHELISSLIDAYEGNYKSAIVDIEEAGKKLQRAKTPVPKGNVLVELCEVTKTYKMGKNSVDAVKKVNLTIHEGEIVALVGPSGSGKSTILNLIGGLDKPSTGSIEVDGVKLHTLNDVGLSKYRGDKIGFVFQFFYLQPFLNLQTNVEVPTMFNVLDKKVRHSRSEELIEAVGLSDRIQHLPKELSGGQMQRAAIARALVNHPKLIIADEPTGNLDSANAGAIMDLFEKVRVERGTTVLIVTHDHSVASRADRIIELKDGEVL